MVLYASTPSKEDDDKGFHKSTPIPQPTEKKGPLND